MSAGNHDSVLLEESVNEVLTDPEGFYIDATFGRGGHSKRMLELLGSEAKLLGVDKDPVAVAVGRELAATDSRFEMVHGSFANLAELVALRGRTVSGVLADLGVSSPQLDDAKRGFSFMQDGPLDMRMNSESGPTAAEWISKADEVEIAKVLREYGEEKFARRIARAIVSARSEAAIETTSQLSRLIAEANPAWEKHKHPATRSFQAIRIHINRELEDLKQFLEDAASSLQLGGKLVVISFHSLEDRLVKQFMRRKARGDEPPPGVPVPERDIKRPFKVCGKAVRPSASEVSENVRARSAVMRVMERVAYE